MLRDDGRLVADGGEWAADAGRLAEVEVPTTIRALLAARLDRLPAEERVLTERASVVGRTFEAAALAELAPEALRGELGRRLVSLVRKELLRHDRADLVPGDAFRFRHVLIRDAAYEMLPKVDRAALHERFAAWLEKVTADRLPEFEEILGYHLEQAAGYRRELGDGEAARRLGLQAGAHLFAAGERASRRGDNAAVIPLMTKAADLLDGPMQVEARLELAIALGGSGHYSAEAEVYESLSQGPAVLADEVLRTRVHVHELVSGLGSPGFPAPRVRRELREAIPRLEAGGLTRDLAWAWLGIGLADVGNQTTGIDAYRASIDHALACGDLRVASAAMANTSALLYGGGSPVGEALTAIEELAAMAPGNPRVRAALQSSRGQLCAMVGRFDEARAMAVEARELCQQMRLTHWEVSVLADRSVVELVAGNPAGAMAAIEEALALAGDLAPLHRWLAGHHVLALAASDRFREALEIIEPLLAVDDDDIEVITRLLRAKAMSLRGIGDLAGAREASDAAIEMLERSGWVPDQATAHLERARIRHLAGDAAWTDDVAAAEDLFRRKGHTVGLGWVAEMRAEASGPR
jgi:tetratricopeptide (TPR) repeat protein